MCFKGYTLGFEISRLVSERDGIDSGYNRQVYDLKGDATQAEIKRDTQCAVLCGERLWNFSIRVVSFSCFSLLSILACQSS
jgi:hypothetical protein